MKSNLRYWQSVLREAERELEAATTRTALDAAAKTLMRAKAELKRLEATASERASAMREDQRLCGSQHLERLDRDLTELDHARAVLQRERTFGEQAAWRFRRILARAGPPAA
jgi:hypothetical protein